MARAQNTTTSSTRSTSPNTTGSVTTNSSQTPATADSTNASTQAALVLDPAVAQGLREDNVLVTQDVQYADTKTLASVARGGKFPVYIVIVRRLPHGFASAASMAETIRLQLDTTSNALVIVATEADGHLGLSASDIEYSTAQEIAERSALVWTQEGYAKGTSQTVRLVEAEREERKEAQANRVIWIGIGSLLFFLAVGSLWAKRRSRNAISRDFTE